MATARAETTAVKSQGSHRLGVTVLLVLVLIGTMMAMASSVSGQVVKIHSDYPRLVFRPTTAGGARTIQSVRDMFNSNGGNNAFQNEMRNWVYSSTGVQPISPAVRYVITGNLAEAQWSLDHMASYELFYTTSVEQVVLWALAYDWIRMAWGSSPSSANLTKMANIEGKIANWVSQALNDVEPNGHSLWHRRGALGAGAFVGSLVLPANNATYDKLRERAFVQWQKTLKMLENTGAWPEGPTYFATSRGVLFPIAWMSYKSAVTSAPALGVANPLEDLRALGLWLAYGERGDGSINRYGDIGSQVDFSNGTLGRVVDTYAAVTRDPNLNAFSKFARKYRYPFYHSQFGWMCAISYDLTLPLPAGYNASDPGASLTQHLPQMMIFGPTSFGQAIIRQGWGVGDTQISFRAGDYMVHHGHNEQGTFTMFKHSKLVINTGGYSTIEVPHRLNYYVRSVAKNTLLIQKPGEIFKPSGVVPSGGYQNDGGQRMINNTGGSIFSVEQWQANKTAGPHYETGDITAADNVDGAYSYVASDITRAYNSTLYDSTGQGGKVSLVQRNMMYLAESDVLLVFDRVRSTNASYKKKWLLHTPNRFAGGSETVVRGSMSDGITVTNGATIPGNIMTMTNGAGRLFLQTVLPLNYTVNKVGGLNHRFYVETDGNDANGYDGTNITSGYTPSAWHDVGDWRVEISPATAQLFDNFLVALTPRSSSVGSPPSAQLLLNTDLAKVVRVQSQYVMFGTQGRIGSSVGYDVAGGGNHRHVLTDLTPGRTYSLRVGTTTQNVVANQAGVISFNSNLSSSYRVGLDESGNPDPVDPDPVDPDPVDPDPTDPDPVDPDPTDPPLDPEPLPIEFTVTLTPGFVYQNNQTTQNRHHSLCLVKITNDPNGNATEDYTVTITKTGGNGNAVVLNTTHPLAKQLRGGLRTDGVMGTGDYNFKVTVTGAKGGTGTLERTLVVRRLGDIDGNGYIDGRDKGLLNSRLNNRKVSGEWQAYDLNGDSTIDGRDMELMNSVLNGVTID